MFQENKKLREFRSISELMDSQEAKEIYKEPVVNRDTGEAEQREGSGDAEARQRPAIYVHGDRLVQG